MVCLCFVKKAPSLRADFPRLAGENVRVADKRGAASRRASWHGEAVTEGVAFVYTWENGDSHSRGVATQTTIIAN